MSIRTQLAIWYSVVFALALMLFGVGVYGIVSFTLIQQVDATLAESAAAIASRSAGGFQGGERVIRLPELDLFRAVVVEAISVDGQILASSIVNLNHHLDPAAVELMRQKPVAEQQPMFTTANHPKAPPIRVYTYPLVGQKSGQLFGYLQVATSLEQVHRAMNGLLATLVSAGIVGLILSSVAGAALAQRAMRPVERITDAAMEIYHTQDLGRRVDVRTNDEVGRLGLAFNEMLDRLGNLFRSQQRFVADVSHEMRTPLTVIRGNVDLLRAMGCADKESLDAIAGETDRMTRLVSDLLLLSQADAGMLPMHCEPINVAPLVADVARSGAIMADGRVSVESSVAGELIVHGDADRIKQVLLNLVENAVKHTPTGGIVRIVGANTDAGMVLLSVSDTGVGIPPEDLPHVFERFYRVDKSRSRAYGGAGLGLAIAKSIIEAHGGDIEVQSVVGVGTTFNVWLPAYQPNLV
ncbi:MAG: ATP-binding protein [Anaerolineae bacterium]|nr:cell wall metabolism sensor histidine kinase WalK [Thermoflexales bacterium]MDW8408428.1 ATP-binding protein [Anaerolineae bacterium]